LIEPDNEGVIHSQVFPGLNFHSERFWADDLVGLLEVLQAGITADQHQNFVAELEGRTTT
jgi:hypothetical protein